MHKTMARGMVLGVLVLGSMSQVTAQAGPEAPARKPEAAEAPDGPARPRGGGIAAEAPDGPAGPRGGGIAAEEPGNRGRGCLPPPPEGPAPRPPHDGPSPESLEQPASRAGTTIDAAAHAKAVKRYAEFLAASAAPTGAPTRRAVIKVPSRSGAQAAPLTVAAGEILRFESRSGKWTVDERTIPLSGPEGHLESLALHMNWGDRREVGTLPFGRLLARVGRSPWIDAGSDKPVRILNSGELSLRINDNDGSLADNAGVLEVEVQVHAPTRR